MRQLYLCCAEVRRLNGIEQRAMPSRFVREIPKELISEVRLRGAVVRPAAPSISAQRDGRVFGGSTFGDERPPADGKHGERKYGSGQYGGSKQFGDRNAADKFRSQPFSASMPASMNRQDPDAPLRIGQRVRHASFGEGVVLGCDGHGDRANVHINFERAGEKRLILGMARLEAVE